MKRLLEVDGRMMVPSAVLLSFEFRSLNFHPPPLGHSEPWVSLGDYTRSISASEQVTEWWEKKPTLLLPGKYGVVGGGPWASHPSSWSQGFLRAVSWTNTI